MGRLSDVCKNIKALDRITMEKTQDKLDSLTKPQGSLGRLEDLAKLIAGIKGNEAPDLTNKVIFTFAADHGVTDEGISAFPKEVTAQMVYNFMRGGAGINVLARHAGARVVIADVGVAADLENLPGLIVKKTGYGTRNMARGSAMLPSDAIRAVENGMDIFTAEFKNGIDIAGTGDMGIGNTTASSAITAVLAKKEVEAVSGKGTGIDDKGLEKKIRIIKEAIRINCPDPDDALDVLAKVGGFEIGALAGVMLEAASRRVPVVIDGFISGAAALIAYHIEPKSRDYMIASHCSVERGHKIILEHLSLKPILDLDLRLGEGTGSALAMNIIEASIKVLTQMASFKEASVSGKLDR